MPGGDRYYLFVDLAQVEDVERAIAKLDGTRSPWHGSGMQRLKIERARDNRERKVFREQTVE